VKCGNPQCERAPEQQSDLELRVGDVGPCYEWQIDSESDQYTAKEAAHTHAQPAIRDVLFAQSVVVTGGACFCPAGNVIAREVRSSLG